MYISWMAVLLGAEVAAALPLWRIDERVGKTSAGGVRLGLSLALLASLVRAQRTGAARTTQELAVELGVATTVIDEHMEPLATAGFVAHTQSGSWVLAWNPETATLRDLYDALQLPFAGSWLGNASAPWQRLIEPAIRRIVRAEAAAAQMTIAALIGETAEAAVRHGSRSRAAEEFAEKIASR
jgi:membrane protein